MSILTLGSKKKKEKKFPIKEWEKEKKEKKGNSQSKSGRKKKREQRYKTHIQYVVGRHQIVDLNIIEPCSRPKFDMFVRNI